MRIDQSGHQHAAAARYDLRVGAAIGRDRIGRNPLNDIAPDQDIRRGRQRGMRAVKYPDILDQGDDRAVLRVQRRQPDGGDGDSAFCKLKESATGRSTHVSSSLALQSFANAASLLSCEVHGRPACRIRLSPGESAINPGLTRGKPHSDVPMSYFGAIVARLVAALAPID